MLIMARISSSPLELHSIYSIRCNKNGPLFCHQCESCKLVQKINLTKAWFIPLSYNSKRMFLERLIVLSDDMHTKITSILSCLHSKDFQYSNSRVKCGTTENGKNMIDKIEENTNHSLDIKEIEAIINQQYLSWYITSSEWTKHNFLMALLKLCTIHLVRSLQLFISELQVFTDKNDSEIPEAGLETMARSPMEFTKPLPRKFFDNNNNYNYGIQKCQSAPLIRTKSALKSLDGKKKRHYSAKERVTFKEIVTTNQNENFIECPLSQAFSRLSKCPSKVVFSEQQSSSARCTPVVAPLETQYDDDDDDDDDILKELNENITSREAERVDLIRFLPIQISKKIFAYFCEKALITAGAVSSHWRYLAKQVEKEGILIQIAKEDIMMMQPASAKVPHPCYVRNVPVHIPKLDNKTGKLVVNCEATHVDVQVLHDEFHDISMEDCYQGWETRKVCLEERNIFCSSYNVLVIDSRKDIHRRIHWLNGNLVAFGSSDRKVHLRDVQTTETVRTITGHSGSVKCVYIDETNNIVASGGYDTTVRVWDIKTGKCKFIFRGHKRSIIALAADNKTVVSASTDSFIKVWNLETGRCKRTFFNNAVMRAVQIVNGMLLTGCSEGIVNIWDVENSVVKKTFTGHKDGITCVKYLKWHIVSGSLDGYVMLWSNVGDLTDCLKTFRHPKEVLCLEVLYCRIITGCEDGKIRLWNMLNGDCLRVIRGNSKNDAIASLFASENRLVVNTLSCVLCYHFEPVEWDHTAPRYRCETSKTVPITTTQRRPHSYHRAMKLQYNGSPLHKSQSFSSIQTSSLSVASLSCLKSTRPGMLSSANTHSSYLDNTCPSVTRSTNTSSSCLDNTRPGSLLSPNTSSFCFDSTRPNVLRAANTPFSCLGNTRSSVLSRGSSSISQHIARIQSAQSMITLHSRRAALHQRDTDTFIETKKSTQIIYENINPEGGDYNISKQKPTGKHIIQTRCRSAPAHRVISLPPGERGFSTTGKCLKTVDSPENKMVLKPGMTCNSGPSYSTKTRTRCLSAKRPVLMSNSNIGLTDLKKI